MQPTGTTSNVNERLITAVRVELARRNISQAAAARRAGISQAALSYRMTGRVSFTVEEIVDLAVACEIPIGALVSDELLSAAASAA